MFNFLKKKKTPTKDTPTAEIKTAFYKESNEISLIMDGTGEDKILLAANIILGIARGYNTPVDEVINRVVTSTIICKHCTEITEIS